VTQTAEGRIAAIKSHQECLLIYT